MVDFGGATFGFEAGVGFEPRWQGVGFLGPMNEGGFVAPVKEFAHGAAVSARDHEALHGGFGGPECDGPESLAAIGEEFESEIAFGARGLPRGAKSVDQKHGHEAPGTDAEASDGDEGHAERMGNDKRRVKSLRAERR